MESSSSSSSKLGKAPLNNNITAHCLADGCTADLRLCRDYHRRHKVCEIHSKTPKVTIGGQHQRFCQQCSRFHSLVEFDEGKRSCRKRLDGHNRRRRKGPAPAPASAPQPNSGGRLGHLSFTGCSSSSTLTTSMLYQDPPINYNSFPQHMTYNINPLQFQFQYQLNNESDGALSLLSPPPPPPLHNNYFQSDQQTPMFQGSSSTPLTFMWDEEE